MLAARQWSWRGSRGGEEYICIAAAGKLKLPNISTHIARRREREPATVTFTVSAVIATVAAGSRSASFGKHRSPSLTAGCGVCWGLFCRAA